MATVHTFTALGQYLLSGAGEGPLEEKLPQELADRLPQYSRADLEEGWQELRELQEAGLLFTTDDYLDPEAAMALPKAAVVKALCLHVSHDCNLRCKYCFASTGDFGTGHRMTMDFETAKKAEHRN